MHRFIYAWLVFLIYILLTSGVHAIFHIPYILIHILFGLFFYFIYGLKGGFIAGFLTLLIMLIGISKMWLLSDTHTLQLAEQLIQKMIRNYSNALFFIIVGTLAGYGMYMIRKVV